MKLYQITDEDLAGLEKDTADLCQSLMGSLSTTDKMAFRRIKTILSNVRWGYGPPEEVEVIPVDE